MGASRFLASIVLLLMTQMARAGEGDAGAVTEAAVHFGIKFAEGFSAARADLARRFPGAEVHFDEMWRAFTTAGLGLGRIKLSADADNSIQGKSQHFATREIVGGNGECRATFSIQGSSGWFDRKLRVSSNTPAGGSSWTHQIRVDGGLFPTVVVREGIKLPDFLVPFTRRVHDQVRVVPGIRLVRDREGYVAQGREPRVIVFGRQR